MLIFVLTYIGAALICIAVIRASLSIPMILKNQKAQTLLLAENAKKHGVNVDDIENILSEKTGW